VHVAHDVLTVSVSGNETRVFCAYTSAKAIGCRKIAYQKSHLLFDKLLISYRKGPGFPWSLTMVMVTVTIMVMFIVTYGQGNFVLQKRVMSSLLKPKAITGK
jgi:hypothetical protein